ncbi:MAG: hypothetical protein MJE77_20815 [Proteobacteria bacterium]|nr:hypothetical protein [Pseudomonadota bacterium]
MYFSGRLQIDPAEITEFRRTGDLQQAMAAFATVAGDREMADFKNIELVLEHHDAHLKYLIDIHVDRIHGLHEYPITIVVNGIVNELALQHISPHDAAVDPTPYRKHLAPVFADNRTYRRYVGEKKHLFDRFVQGLERAVRSQIHTDQVIYNTKKNIVRPSSRVATRRRVYHQRDSDVGDPLFYGYYGFEEAFFYCWLWSELCHDPAIHVADTTIVDETGHDVLDIGASGFDASQVATLDPDMPMSVPTDADAVAHDGNAYAADLAPALSAQSQAATDTVSTDAGDSTSSSSWLGSRFSGSGDSGCSSSRSCGSSCGSSA